jgi:putative effector of murein hydrolase LrgA (UPF0299 family)
MPFLNVVIVVVCSWLLLLAVTGVIEHIRLRRDEHRLGVPRASAARKISAPRL